MQKSLKWRKIVVFGSTFAFNIFYLCKQISLVVLGLQISNFLIDRLFVFH